MPTLAVKDFDLAATIRSGHLFAYDELGNGRFHVVDGESCFAVWQDRESRNKLNYEGISEHALRAFFDLDLDVDALHARLAKEKALAPLLTKYRGIRLVRQDARQAILTFILSSNNNQKRIKQMLDSLRSRHGARIGDHHALPRRDVLTHVDDLAGLKFGYRDAFIVGTERLLTEEFLERLRLSDYADAKAQLQTLPGVGPKVADCVLAYSALAKGEAFPADVWVKRALTTWYKQSFKNKTLSDRHITAFAKKRFGHDAAYAQHYLFLAAQELL